MNSIRRQRLRCQLQQSSTSPSGDDYTGLLAVLAGGLLLGLGIHTLWVSPKRIDTPWWRHGRRLLIGIGALVAAYVFVFPTAVAYFLTHTARAGVPSPLLGRPVEDVAFTRGGESYRARSASTWRVSPSTERTRTRAPRSAATSARARQVSPCSLTLPQGLHGSTTTAPSPRRVLVPT
jgi:hypothetical protein